MEIKFWYGGKKHVAKDAAEQDKMIAGFVKSEVDPYTGFKAPGEVPLNELDIIRNQLKEQAAEIAHLKGKKGSTKTR